VEIRSSNGSFFFATHFFNVSSFAGKYITKSGMGMCAASI
jgi:hypothetical protein